MCQQTAGAGALSSNDMAMIATTHAKSYAPLMAHVLQAMVLMPREGLLNSTKLRELASLLSLIRRESNSLMVEAETASFVIYDTQLPLERRLAAALPMFVQELRNGTAVRVARHELPLDEVSFGRDRCVPMMSRECLLCFDILSLCPYSRLVAFDGRTQYAITFVVSRIDKRNLSGALCKAVYTAGQEVSIINDWMAGVCHRERKDQNGMILLCLFVWLFVLIGSLIGVCCV
jgi:hypothetical protein